MRTPFINLGFILIGALIAALFIDAILTLDGAPSPAMRVTAIVCAGLALACCIVSIWKGEGEPGA